MTKETTDPLSNTERSVATDKNTITTSASSIDSNKAVRSYDDEENSSLDGADGGIAIVKHEVPDTIPEFTINMEHHQNRSVSSLNIPPGLERSLQMRRRKSDSAPQSGSRSPRAGGSNHSSISSMEEQFDPDILTDKMGFLELDLKEQQESCSKLNDSFSNLAPLTERMSEENLDDCHAFSDLKAGSASSRGNSIATGGEVSSNVLEPLEECEDEEEDNEGEQVIFTNMEKILETAEKEDETPLDSSCT
jgi:hypothetical protein